MRSRHIPTPEVRFQCFACEGEGETYFERPCKRCKGKGRVDATDADLDFELITEGLQARATR